MGLAQRYATIYLPAVAGLAQDLLPTLQSYVENGGRLILDAPGSWLDTFGRVPATGRGSAFERLFGATLDDFQHSGNVSYSVRGNKVEGFVATVTPTTGNVLQSLDTGAPLIVEHRVGSGSAVLVTTSLSMSTFKPGNAFFETLLVETAIGNAPRPFTCEGAIAYRLASPAADHYFLINDGPATIAQLSFQGDPYALSEDAVTGESIQDAGAIPVEADGGRWIRFSKA
jgi:beta-galactosidase